MGPGRSEQLGPAKQAETRALPARLPSVFGLLGLSSVFLGSAISHRDRRGALTVSSLTQQARTEQPSESTVTSRTADSSAPRSPGTRSAGQLDSWTELADSKPRSAPSSGTDDRQGMASRPFVPSHAQSESESTFHARHNERTGRRAAQARAADVRAHAMPTALPQHAACCRLQRSAGTCRLRGARRMRQVLPKGATEIFGGGRACVRACVQGEHPLHTCKLGNPLTPLPSARRDWLHDDLSGASGCLLLPLPAGQLRMCAGYSGAGVHVHVGVRSWAYLLHSGMATKRQRRCRDSDEHRPEGSTECRIPSRTSRAVTGRCGRSGA